LKHKIHLTAQIISIAQKHSSFLNPHLRKWAALTLANVVKDTMN